MARIIKPRKAARWTKTAPSERRTDIPQLQSWTRAAGPTDPATEPPSTSNRFAKYDVKPSTPTYDSETYEKHLTHNEWSKEETDYLVDLYRDCNGKWPVIIDQYEHESGPERTMEDLKARFYSISATLLALATPITSMAATEYTLYEMLNNFNPAQETSRKKLAEGHLYRRSNEVDEETVLLGELQRIMLNQATLDNQREELRKRLDYPVGNTGGFQYTTSANLTQLWQQLLAQDRMKKNPRLRPTGNPMTDGFSSLQTPLTASRPSASGTHRDSIATASEALQQSRRPTRDSLPSATPSNAPLDLSKSDSLRFGVVQQADKLPNGVTFAGDRLSKPRIAKSSIQTEKIAAILTHVGVPELIPLPTPQVVESFDSIMHKVQTLLELRKVAEKEEQELKVRTAEAG